MLDNELRQKIVAAGQEHVLKFWDELDETSRQTFAQELADVDWHLLPQLTEQYVLRKPETKIPEDLSPALYYPLDGNADLRDLFADAEALGTELLRSGKVCCLTVAGGQGTRLGFDAPKGTYPIGPVSDRTLFEYFAGAIARSGEKYGKAIPWYIMTSPVNREATEAFFREKNYFGLPAEQIFFFTQGTMPAFGRDGKLLLADKGRLSLSPDGHGGTLLALRKSGALDKMKADGSEIISYFQVDNPLVPVVYPRFIGLMRLDNAEVGAISLTKTGPYEKLGNFCVSEERTHIIEYSDLPDYLAEKRNPDGSLCFAAGSPAIHVFARDFIDRLTAGGELKLPWHRADKKITAIDGGGNVVKPDEPNGVKLETFIFDTLPLAEKVILLEGDRNELFAPTKNATGVDSVESCRAMISARNARRLAEAGVKIPRNADGTLNAAIEISPFAACDDEDVAEMVKARQITEIAPGGKIIL